MLYSLIHINHAFLTNKHVLLFNSYRSNELKGVDEDAGLANQPHKTFIENKFIPYKSVLLPSIIINNCHFQTIVGSGALHAKFFGKNFISKFCILFTNDLNRRKEEKL